MPPPIVIAAGGTGGHLFPAEAVADELRRRGERVVLMTDARAAGYRGTAFAENERIVLRAGGIAGRGLGGAVRGVVALAAGMVAARRYLAALAPAAVVGFGGYASVPPLLAARLLPRRQRPAVIVHEQNAVLGRANRLLARFADRLALSFPATRLVPPTVSTVVVGNPVRPAIAALAGQPYPTPGEGSALKLLVIGGSQGARIFAAVVPAALALLPEEMRARLIVTQQCRSEDLSPTEAAYRACGVVAELAPFFPDIAGRLATAHLIIARAGASSVAEIACAGRPAILVPLPSAIDDHQHFNALALAEADAAWLMPQSSFTASRLAERLAGLFAAPQRLQAAAAKAAALARPRAAVDLATCVLALVQSVRMRAV